MQKNGSVEKRVDEWVYAIALFILRRQMRNGWAVH
jgi:hypothetical protein